MLCTYICLSFVNATPILSFFTIQIQASYSKWVLRFLNHLKVVKWETFDKWGFRRWLQTSLQTGFWVSILFGLFVCFCWFFCSYSLIRTAFTNVYLFFNIICKNQNHSLLISNIWQKNKWGKGQSLSFKFIWKSECNLYLLSPLHPHPPSFVSTFGWVLFPFLLIPREYYLHKYSLKNRKT